VVRTLLQVNGLVIMITKEEIEWLNYNFPDLHVDEANGVIEGVVWFNSVYDRDSNKFTAFLKPNTAFSGTVLSGEYRIKITDTKKARRVPKLQVFIDKSKQIANRHFYDTGKGDACVAGPAEEDDLFSRYSFLEFFELFVIQFLYAQSYYDEYHKWPWFGYEHHAAGVLQSFSRSGKTKEQTSACLKRVRKTSQWDEVKWIMLGRFDGRKCPCGSRGMIGRCHTDLIRIARDFYNTCKQYGLTV
jgi:hypothetical protein